MPATNNGDGTVSVESGTSDGLDIVSYAPGTTDWVTYLFEQARDEVVVISSSGASCHVSRSATGAFSTSGTAQKPVAEGVEWRLQRRSPRNALSSVRSLHVSLSAAAGMVHFEILGAGREE